ncbi:hypothetical protein [Actinomadura sp. WMMB 499]|uniref:hypothetical protein n=1 Tax=Actinomadura sp. WMMB 499 TaxID=1219491 RepID=UPI00159D3E46|nr:hypothetical protein [Actinomadura sp. WMMB 499]
MSGTLSRFKDESDPEAAANLPVHVYFMPAGSSTWTEVAVTRTGTDGAFEKSFTANEDGYWTAWFWGDGDHAKSNSATVHVDVR